MNCDQVKRQFHDWWDGELPVLQAVALEEHLNQCSACGGYRTEMEAVRTFLSTSHPLSEMVSRQLWEKVRPRSRGTLWIDRLFQFASSIKESASLNRRGLLAKLAAAPITVVMFAFLSSQFAVPSWQAWTYTIVPMGNLSASGRAPAPIMVQVLQSKEELRSLVNTAWKLPFDDSLSLVADIQPEGNAEIQSILEFPRSTELLNAVDSALRNSRFESPHPHTDSLLIYSFQKIDVYAGL